MKIDGNGAESFLNVTLTYTDDKGKLKTETKDIKNNGATFSFSGKMQKRKHVISTKKCARVDLGTLRVSAASGQVLATAYKATFWADPR